MGYEFDGVKAKNDCIKWIRKWFDENGKGCNAVIGISGGKDSTIAATLLVEALGKDRVYGVVMPNGDNQDEMSFDVLEYLGIKWFTVNIQNAYNSFIDQLKDCDIEVTEQTKINLAPRLRMSALYAVSQSLNGRVVNTCNYSEDYVGYSTRYGDSAGDFSPLGDFTVSEVKCIGRALGLPNRFIEKVPSDGLCGKSDEDNLGFTYDTLDGYIREGVRPEEGVAELIDKKHKNNLFKLKTIPVFRQDVTYDFGKKITRHILTYEWR